ncbi:MAG: hypothetical protein GY924_17435, partial [Planctomycetaceae bacterium]|nr:hypothetical protein [Planctomycetaceae bacterium]
MSFCFDHPDDAASWQGNRGKVRSMQEMLSDVDATLRLVEKAIAPEAIESETVAPETVAPETVAPETVAPETIESETTRCQHPDSQHSDALFFGWAGFSTRDASLVSEVQHITAPDSDFGNLGEPLLVASAGSLLQQIALIQQAVSVAVVISQC